MRILYLHAGAAISNLVKQDPYHLRLFKDHLQMIFQLRDTEFHLFEV